MKIIFDVICSKYRCDEEAYDDILCLCVALTNCHISFHPFCYDQDASYYQCYKTFNYKLGDKITRQDIADFLVPLAAIAISLRGSGG